MVKSGVSDRLVSSSAREQILRFGFQDMGKLSGVFCTWGQF